MTEQIKILPGLESLGDKFLTPKGEAGKEILAGVRLIGLLFGGSWCPPCKPPAFSC